MKIETIEAAFSEIEKKQEQVPIEAIEFLHNCKTNKLITDKITFALENAYNDEVYYDKKDNYYYPTPLWYAIVAEEHLCEDLIQPIISLFITEAEDDWDYLDEQGSFLTGKLCEAFREKAVTPILETVREYSKLEVSYPTLFLFDCLYFIDKEKHLPIIFDILKNPEYTWLEPFIIDLAHIQLTETLERIKEIKELKVAENDKDNILFRSMLADYEEVIKELETGVPTYPEQAIPFFKSRANWKDYYKDFYKEEQTFVPPLEKKKKIGRNDPCVCGSGLKYKKCCLPKLKAGEILPHL